MFVVVEQKEKNVCGRMFRDDAKGKVVEKRKASEENKLVMKKEN